MVELQTIKMIYAEIFSESTSENLSKTLFGTDVQFHPRNVQRCLRKIALADTRDIIKEALQELKDSGF